MNQMHKTEKLLYGGFAVVALAVIVAMLVSIFSPPKQIVEETETVETPKATVEKPIEDVPNQMEQWQRNVEATRLQREANEAWVKLIQVEKEWWESRKNG